jgi:hypothetical protein
MGIISGTKCGFDCIDDVTSENYIRNFNKSNNVVSFPESVSENTDGDENSFIAIDNKVLMEKPSVYKTAYFGRSLGLGLSGVAVVTGGLLLTSLEVASKAMLFSCGGIALISTIAAIQLLSCRYFKDPIEVKNIRQLEKKSSFSSLTKKFNNEVLKLFTPQELRIAFYKEYAISPNVFSLKKMYNRFPDVFKNFLSINEEASLLENLNTYSSITEKYNLNVSSIYKELDDKKQIWDLTKETALSAAQYLYDNNEAVKTLRSIKINYNLMCNEVNREQNLIQRNQLLVSALDWYNIQYESIQGEVETAKRLLNLAEVSANIALSIKEKELKVEMNFEFRLVDCENWKNDWMVYLNSSIKQFCLTTLPEREVEDYLDLYNSNK